MINVIYPVEFGSAPSERLNRLGLAHRSFTGANVTELTKQTQELVYLVPIQAMDADSWPRLRVRFAQGNRPYIVWLDTPSTNEVARSMRDGASDVLSNQDSDDRWRQAMIALADNQKAWLELYGGQPLSASDVLVGRSDVMQRLRQTIDRLGPTDVCVLLLGESGVGKERVASALHKAGHGGPFIPLNCAAIPKDLLESELFGVEKGAFTGALKSRPGLVEQASGGTLFLDEIGEMELGVQPKLLRFLETRKARRVGGEAEYKVDLRVISATNRNLEAEIAGNRFRPDLYYRLGELILQIPPLRARPEDIPELAMNFLRGANERFGKNFESLEPALIARFQDYDWPGNVRELKSAVDRLVLLFDGPMLRAPWWEPGGRWTPSANSPPANSPPAASAAASETPVPGPSPVSAEPPAGRHVILNTKQKLALARKLLAESDNNYSWVAGQLGVNSSTLWRWRKGGKLD